MCAIVRHTIREISVEIKHYRQTKSSLIFVIVFQRAVLPACSIERQNHKQTNISIFVILTPIFLDNRKENVKLLATLTKYPKDKYPKIIKIASLLKYLIFFFKRKFQFHVIYHFVLDFCPKMC